MLYTREIAKALVRAFNVNNRFSDTVETNFTLQSSGKKDYLVVSFDKDMGRYQCGRYLDSIKRKIIHEFYGIDEDNDKEILDTAELIFDIKSFPFDISKGELLKDKQHGFKFAIRVDEGVIFNLKSHLASSLKKNVLEDMPTCSIFTNAFNKKEYLWHGKFSNKELREQFKNMFLSRYPNNLLKVKSNDVYIRNIFDDIRFIDSITQYNAWLIGRSLQASSKSRSDVRAFKNLIIEFINQSTGLIVIGFMCAPPSNGKGASILIPVILGSEGPRILTNEEALSINDAFYGIVFSDVDGKTHAKLPVDVGSGIYGIDFYNPQVSYCVVTKIIESSVINKNHELTIDPELYTIDSSQLQQSIGAGESLQEVDIWLQQKDPWLSQGTHEDKWLQSPQPGPSSFSQQRPSLWPQVSSSVPLSLEDAQASANKWGISEKEKELIEDERAMSNPSGKQDKSNTVDADESSRSGKFSKAKSEEDRVSSKSGSRFLKKHEALQSESSSSKCADELEQGASNGFSASSESSGEYEEDRAKNESPKRYRVLYKLRSLLFSKSDQPDENFKRHDVRRVSTQSTPMLRISKKLPVSKQCSFPGRRKAWSNLPSEVSSSAHLKDTPWQLPKIIIESAPPAEDKSQQLRPKASVSRNSSDSSNDSGFKSVDPSPRSSLTPDAANLIQQPDISKSDRFSDKSSKEGSPDTSGGIKKQLPFIPFPQTQLTEPSSFSAMQDTRARKEVTGGSNICSTNL